MVDCELHTDVTWDLKKKNKTNTNTIIDWPVFKFRGNTRRCTKSQRERGILSCVCGRRKFLFFPDFILHVTNYCCQPVCNLPFPRILWCLHCISITLRSLSCSDIFQEKEQQQFDCCLRSFQSLPYARAVLMPTCVLDVGSNLNCW